MANNEECVESWDLNIARRDNGYTLAGTDLDIVLEDNDNDSLDSHEQLLHEVMNYFAFQDLNMIRKELLLVELKIKSRCKMKKGDKVEMVGTIQLNLQPVNGQLLIL